MINADHAIKKPGIIANAVVTKATDVVPGESNAAIEIQSIRQNTGQPVALPATKLFVGAQVDEISHGGRKVFRTTVGNYFEQKVVIIGSAVEGVPRYVPGPRVSDHSDNRQSRKIGRNLAAWKVIADELLIFYAVQNDVIKRLTPGLVHVNEYEAFGDNHRIRRSMPGSRVRRPAFIA